MIRKTLLAIAAVATIAGAATSAQAGYYGHGGYHSHGGYKHGYKRVYQPSYHFVRKCHRVKVGHRKVYDPYTYSYFFKPVYKRHCKRVKIWH